MATKPGSVGLGWSAAGLDDATQGAKVERFGAPVPGRCGAVSRNERRRPARLDH